MELPRTVGYTVRQQWNSLLVSRINYMWSVCSFLYDIKKNTLQFLLKEEKKHL